MAKFLYTLSAATAIFSAVKMYNIGDEVLRGMAEEYSLCTSVNQCSYEEIITMAEILVDEHPKQYPYITLYPFAVPLRFLVGVQVFSWGSP